MLRKVKVQTPAKRCAQFCAHPQSETIANGSKVAEVRIASICAENQRYSRASYSVLMGFGRSLNQRVGGSSPPRFTKPRAAAAV